MAGGSVLAQTLDTLAAPATDSLPVTNSVGIDSAGASKAALMSDSVRVDSARVSKGAVNTTVTYGARDSIRFDVVNQTVYLFGETQIEYGDINLKADTTEINWQENTLTARGGSDTTGKAVGTPIFREGAEEYVAEDIRYNFRTRKGIIEGVVTEEGEGYLHGEVVKKNADDELFVRKAQYTTCNLAHPHFHINASRVKVIPGDQLITGPFNLVVADVPTPLGFPFGLFPTPKRQASGIIVPVYGEARDLGFFLRDGGFYWAVNDYLGLRFTGSVWSKGSFGLQTAGQYKKRYRYDGRFGIRFNRRVEGDEGFENEGEDFWIDWSHNPVSFRSSRFTVSINAGTSNFNRRAATNTQDYLSNTFRSAITYNKNFQGTPFSLTASAQQDQNTTTGVMNFTLPSVALNMNRVFPFKPRGAPAKTWYQKIGASYSFSTANRISNSPAVTGFPFPTIEERTDDQIALQDSVLPFNAENFSEILSRNQLTGAHDIPISTSLNLFKYITVAPSVNYKEFWYQRRFDYTYRETPDARGVDVDTTTGFFRAYEYSASVATNTALYGIYQFPKAKRVQAVRHVVRPSLGFNYRPDFGDPRFGFYQTVRTDTTALAETRSVSRFYGEQVPGTGLQGSISFGVSNQFEAKIRPRADPEADTVGKAEKRVLIDNIGFNTSYNMAADSLNLADFSFSLRTQVAPFNINLGMAIDPYVYAKLLPDADANGNFRQVQINEYAWNRGQGIGQITSASLALSTNLNPEALRRKQEDIEEKRNNPTLTPTEREELEQIAQNPDLYVDFSIPWSLRVSYNLNYRRTGFNPATITQNLRFDGNVSLTEKWKVTFNTSYDFVNKGFGFTNIGISRDLHCWQMNFTWVPFGFQQSYSFEIRAKASILQDLKLNRRRNWQDRNIL